MTDGRHGDGAPVGGAAGCRHQAEGAGAGDGARAEASERLSDEIIASLTAGLLVVSLHGEVQIVNPVGRRMLDLDEGPHRGVALPAAAGARGAARRAHRASASVPAARSSAARSSCRQPRRASLHLGLTRVAAFGDDSSAPHGAICLFTDLTAVVALEEQLRLKDSLARVGELTAGIAHEFRNGLATIHGYSRLLDLDALPPQFRPYVEGIRAETEALRRGRDQLPELRAARLSSTLSPVDLGAIAERAADDLRADARALAGDITRRRASSRRSRATTCCCGRRSATCCGTPSRPARLPAPSFGE